MKKILKKLGWLTYSGKWDWNEMLIDIVVIVMVSISLYVLHIVSTS